MGELSKVMRRSTKMAAKFEGDALKLMVAKKLLGLTASLGYRQGQKIVSNLGGT